MNSKTVITLIVTFSEMTEEIIRTIPDALNAQLTAVMTSIEK